MRQQRLQRLAAVEQGDLPVHWPAQRSGSLPGRGGMGEDRPAVCLVLLHPLHVAPLQLLPQLTDAVGQPVAAHGLEQILEGTLANGLLGVGKIRKGADQHNLHGQGGLMDAAEQLQAAEPGHADIGDNDLRRLKLNLLPGCAGVVELPGDLKAQLLPVQQALQADHGPGLVVNQKNPVHAFPPYHGCRRARRCARWCPGPGCCRWQSPAHRRRTGAIGGRC